MFQPDPKERPVIPTPSHTPVVPDVKESVVQGFEKALVFYPNTFYDFKVIGAGTQNNNPGEGDVRWVPVSYTHLTDDPNTNPDAKFIDVVENLDDNLLNMGKGTSGSKVGTGGMATKLTAAQIASAAGVDMVIANGADFHIIHKITEGRRYGTLFVSPFSYTHLETGR